MTLGQIGEISLNSYDWGFKPAPIIPLGAIHYFKLFQRTLTVAANGLLGQVFVAKLSSFEAGLASGVYFNG